MKTRPLLVAAGLAALLGQHQAKSEIKNVIHITVDGLRGDLLKGLMDGTPASYANFRKLRAEGAATFNARCDYDYSETIPNHSCVVTGRPVLNPPGITTAVGHAYISNGYTGNASTGDSLHQLGTATYSYKASTFDMAHDRGFSTAIYAGKTRLNLYLHSYNATKGRADTVGVDNGKNKVDFSSIADAASAATLTAVKTNVVASITGNTLKNYTLVHFTDTDTGTAGGGHSAGWGSANWNTAVSGVDGYLGEIINAINNAGPNIKNKTAIVLTADHGGGGGGAGPGATPDKNHGDNASQLNYTIPVIIWGPGIPANIDAHNLFNNRADPSAARPVTSPAQLQPLRNADTANICMGLLGCPIVEGSWFVPVFAEGILATSTAANTILVTWPSYLTNTRLQSSSSLQSNTWTTETMPPMESNGRFLQMFNIPTGSRMFWRLTPPQ